MTNRTRRRLPALLLVLLAACSAGHHQGVASAGGSTSSTAAASLDQGFIDYAQCMRDHGVADFPDPGHRPGHDGLSLQYEGDTGSAIFKAADEACQHFLQAIIDMKRRSVAATLTPEKLQALIAYSRCMRDHQVPLLDPDPVDGHISFGQVAGLTEPPLGRRDPLFATADATCRSVLPAGTPDDGTGPP